MAPMEEPTVAEMIRTLGSQVAALTAGMARLESAISQYVTQEQRTADQLLAAEKERQQNERIATLETRHSFWTKAVATSLVAPLLVALMVWMMTRGTS